MFQRGIFPLAVCAIAVLSVHDSGAEESRLGMLRDRVRQEPRNLATALEYGHALRLAGREAEALAQLRRADASVAEGREAANLLRIRWEIARTHMQRGDFGRAFAACQTMAPLEGGIPSAHACSAEAHLVWMRGGEAEREVRAALASGDVIPEAKIAEGRADELRSDDAAAEEAFRAGITANPDDPAGHEALGALLLRTGRAADGIAELRTALSKEPGDAELLVRLGKVLPAGDESRQLFERATVERPTWAPGWMAAADAELAAGVTDAAKKAAKVASKLSPKDASSHVVLGRVQLAEKEPLEAREEGKRALSLLANSADAKLLVGDADGVLGEIDDALVAYESAWGFDRSHATALLRAAALCVTAGRNTSARAFAEKATTEFKTDPRGWMILGDVLAAEKDRSAAKAAYETALPLISPEYGVSTEAVRRKLEAVRSPAPSGPVAPPPR